MHRESPASWGDPFGSDGVPGLETLSARTTPHGPIPILAYHQIGEQPPRGTPYRNLVLPRRKLALQLAALRAMGWRGLALRDLVPYLRGERHGKVFGITFDDGYENNLRFALPILTSLGFTATVFVVSGQLGGTNEWDRPRGVPPARIMDVDQMQSWEAAGMEVGAHSRTHPILTSCDRESALAEIHGSKADLESVLGHPITSFSYPHGLFSDAHVDAVRAAGFQFAVTTRMAKVREGDDVLQLPRFSALADESTTRFLLRVATGLSERLARARQAVAGRSSPQAAASG